MVNLFWTISIVLMIFALAFFIPWIRNWRISVSVVFLFILISYGSYAAKGNSHFLKDYYSDQKISLRLRHKELQKQLTQFKKAEWTLRVKLESDPKDSTAQWKLLDILATQALYQGEFLKAGSYWKQAYALLLADPWHKKYGNDEARIKHSILILMQLNRSDQKKKL